MTPSELISVDRVRLSCENINLTVGYVRDCVMIYTANGSLLRGFQLWTRESKIDARDFANWWRFMGYDK